MVNDELKSKIGEACRGRSTAEITETIMASKHADMVPDPQAVAALCKSWNPDGGEGLGEGDGGAAAAADNPY